LNKANIVFDSRNTYFKSPRGAVRTGTELLFRLLVSQQLRPASVRLIIKYDRHDLPAVYEMNGGGETPVETDDYREYYVTFPIHDTGLYWYHFEVLTESGHLRIGKGDSNNAVTADVGGDWQPGNWQQTVYDRSYAPPDWICGGIYYHIFVDRFRKSGRPRVRMEGKTNRHDWGGVPEWKPKNLKVYNNDFFGGDLDGIRQKLPYLAELNVTCIYLSPIFEAYSSHKYDTGDYEKVDAMFGSEEDFRALCEEAARYDIRVICDGVFAHTGSDSKYFDKYDHYKTGPAAEDRTLQGAYENPDSKYRSWYYFHEDGTYDCWWDFPTLPKLNKHDPSYKEYITGENGIIRKWLRAGASGWRLDVADELPVEFLDALVSAAKAEKPDALIVGEVWEDASNKIAYDERKNYFEGNRLDAVMNYPFRSGIIDFVRHGNAEGLVETVETIVENYPPEVLHCLMNVLGTHDSIRILTALAGVDLGPNPSRAMQAEIKMSDAEWAQGIRLLKTASLIQMTLPGVPCIYYGDEAGLEGYKDPFNRSCYPWGRECVELLGWYKKITQVRTSRSVYRCGAYRTLAAAGGMYAFERYEESGSDGTAPIITAANCGNLQQHLPLEGNWRDLLTGSAYDGTIAMFPGDTLLLEKI
jgi:glycosidase